MSPDGPILYRDESFAVRGAVYEVYSQIGSGFLEEVYQEAMERELALRQIPFEAQPTLKIPYKGSYLQHTYRPDLVCYGKIIVELKAVKALLPEHEAQLINYLRASGIRLGLLVNFSHLPKAQIISRVL